MRAGLIQPVGCSCLLSIRHRLVSCHTKLLRKASLVAQPDLAEFERELIRSAIALADQGVSALEPIYDLTAGRLLRYASFLTRTQTEAEDVMQLCFLRLARAPEKLAKAQRPWAYLLQVMRNEAYTLLYRRKSLEQISTVAYLPDRHLTAEDEWERKQSVHRALTRLPPIQAEVITLKIWEGLTLREIATVTDATVHTVASRYRYGMQKLEKLLQAYDERPDCKRPNCERVWHVVNEVES
ncbi:MAG: RNA polymerase subunit sigma-70 [Planctomyces sp.]|nr:RNA polymerase subunit sigma-70 [Planctomyces sp.]